MIALLAKQHLLPSSNLLFGKLDHARLFAKVDLVTKEYSDIGRVVASLPAVVKMQPSVERYFKTRPVDHLVLLDEGGGLHDALPVDVAGRAAGMEQTTSGLRKIWKCPMVLVCRSAAKMYFESQIITRGIVRKLESLDLLAGRSVGVVGLGALGSEIVRALLDRGVPTLGTEIGSVPPDLAPVTVPYAELFERSDVILGCSGRDALKGTDIGRFEGRKTLASCSSTDVEFRSILGRLPGHAKFGTAQGVIGKAEVVVLNGGFPINFDRQTEWESLDEIRLTRELCFAGVVQAMGLIGSDAHWVMLEPARQLRIVQEWLEQVPNRGGIRMPGAMTETFFRNHSEGEHTVVEKCKYRLHDTTAPALARMRAHKSSYVAVVSGVPIVVLPNVWSPAYDWSSSFYIENLPDVRDREFLEIGCGTGVISVFASRAGAARVVATDVNEDAVRNACINFERFGIKNAEVFVSDVFAEVSGRFDIVTWNAPFHGAKPTDMLERGCSCYDYCDIRLFFQTVSQHLKPDGSVVFEFSESGDLPLIESLIQDNGFAIRRKLSDWRQGYNCILFDLIQAQCDNGRRHDRHA